MAGPSRRIFVPGYSPHPRVLEMEDYGAVPSGVSNRARPCDIRSMMHQRLQACNTSSPVERDLSAAI